MPRISEHQVSTAFAAWLKHTYPFMPFRFDLIADMPLPMKFARRNGQLHGALFTKGHPDVLIYVPGGKPVFLELKATQTVPKSKHTATQRAYHEVLRGLGYDADFYCGLKEAQNKVLNVMQSKKVKKWLSKT